MARNLEILPTGHDKNSTPSNTAILMRSPQNEAFLPHIYGGIQRQNHNDDTLSWKLIIFARRASVIMNSGNLLNLPPTPLSMNLALFERQFCRASFDRDEMASPFVPVILLL